MKKIILSIFIVIIFLILPVKIFAQTISDHSAFISYNKQILTENNKKMIQKLVIKKILERYNSPMIEVIDSFIENCYQYRLNCYLLPAISGLESFFGQYIYPASFNPFGWGGGYFMFKNWNEAIETVAKGLRQDYLNKGAESIDQIGSIYAESATWASRVNFFITLFENEERKFGLFLIEKKVEL